MSCHLLGLLPPRRFYFVQWIMVVFSWYVMGGRDLGLCPSHMSPFICLATRAIHLELVSDLTANAFIAALRRFMARRGIPSQLYSDNGMNFRKARNVLHDLYNLWHNKDATLTIQSFATSHGIKWSFIPPSSPHFGGLWESGIRVWNIICAALSASLYSHLRSLLQFYHR